MSLTSVEAEASHRTQKAESEAASRVRLVEDKLRLVQREADSARASLARERTRRGANGGSGGGSGKSSTEMAMDRQHQQQQQQQQQVGGHGLQHRSDGMQNKQHGSGKRVVTPPEQTAASAAAAGNNTTIDESARFQPILSSVADSGKAGSGAGPSQSRSQRVASHLLLNLDLLWPEEGGDAATAGMAASAVMVTSGGGEGAKPPQSKRQRRQGGAAAGSDGGASAKGGGLTRSGAIHPGSREAERYKAAAARRGQKEPNPSTSRDKGQDAANTMTTNTNQCLPAGNAANVGSPINKDGDFDFAARRFAAMKSRHSSHEGHVDQ